ncbi:mycobactin polyketide synthase MbtD [Mycobacterium sp. 852002-10029_SCH5224772]|uniref:mycobactin polyketide synthase MbtD n=1 Tax=Mycobacterium sp. 852002-10029_SCH5224772 TaxID=1834083 RepID=UPI0007FEEC2C|nr:mycobactin polyketide synthase MbtD [Mycobacterium sp. 852002-10029_SCH5224772]OBF11205.1 polyketide synthase [Mycobacterium sp. 852002-10029_SCH5224772]
MLTHRLPDGRIPVLLSSHDPELIRRDAAAILDYLGRIDSSNVTAAVASTLLRLRRARRHRAVLRAADSAELVAGLSAIARGDEHELVTQSAKTTPPRIAFVFPGQGNQWQAMGADAYRQLPAYREAADRCAEAFTVAGFASPLPYLVGEEERNWSRPEIQGAQFTHAVSLAEAWRSCGVLPDITIGHSLGEVAAAYVAEALSLPDAVALVVARATVVSQLTGRYAMAVLGTGLDIAEALLAEAPGWLEVSAVNGPSSTVVAGDHDAVAATVRLAQQRDIFTHQLSVDYPGHTSALRPLRAALAELTPRSAFRDGPVRFVGSTLGTELRAATEFSGYWYENLCGTVRFDLAVQYARGCGADTFVELSAHPSLLYPLGDIVDDESVVVGSGHRDRPITETLSASIAAVATTDPGRRWADAVPVGDPVPLRGFPNTPMRAVHLWAAPERATEPSPVRALTVAVEDWQHTTSPITPIATQPDIGFFGADALTRRLAEAVAAHGGCRVVPPNDAEILVVAAPALDQLDAAAAIEQIAARPDAGLPDYPALIGPRCRAVWLLTAGAEHIDRDDTHVSPAQAALAAMHRSVGFEFPDQAFGHLDLEHRDVDAATARAVVDVLSGEPAEVALRGGASPPRHVRRHVRTFRACRESATGRPLDAPALDDVVITGGSGAIGLQYARYCLERGARTVTLLSRNGVDPAALRELADGHDAEVRAPQCDITDRTALASVAATYAGSGASLLIHTAGIAQARSRADLTGADVAAVCAAKVRGLVLMADLWPLRPDCRILACSSVFGTWGGYSHAAYAASNRMLDVLAAQLRAEGRDCTALRWGLWQGAGVVVGNEIARTERSGLVAMEPQAAIEASLYRYEGDPLIFDADFDRLQVFFESQGMPMPFTASHAVDDGAAANISVAKPLADVVRAELAATLHLGDSLSIDPGTSLIDLGMDSLLALDLRKRLRRTVGNSVPVARMLGGITVNELIDALRADSPGGPTAPPAFDRTGTASGAHHSTLAMLERLDS